MTPEIAIRLGRAFTVFLLNRGVGSPKVVVGRDTRISGQMIESALSAGIASAGGDVYAIGEIPTPGVSHALSSGDFDGGAVISASHNPAEYNGIKYLDGAGFKLSDEEELQIEELLRVTEEESGLFKAGSEGYMMQETSRRTTLIFCLGSWIKSKTGNIRYS